MGSGHMADTFASYIAQEQCAGERRCLPTKKKQKTKYCTRAVCRGAQVFANKEKTKNKILHKSSVQGSAGVCQQRKNKKQNIAQEQCAGERRCLPTKKKQKTKYCTRAVCRRAQVFANKEKTKN